VPLAVALTVRPSPTLCNGLLSTLPDDDTSDARRIAGVSVVIPVKDDAGPLERCLRALAGQTVAPAEIVVVDNASADGSAEVARRFGARVVAESAPGIAAAAARGYDAARCSVIGRMDADCVPDARWVERVEQHFEAHPRDAAVTGLAHFVDGPRLLRRPGAALYLGAYLLCVGAALAHPPLFGSNCALRRSEWMRIRDTVHRSDLLLHDDIDLSVHLGPVARIRVDPGLRMGIAVRPFTEGGLALRFRRGMHSILTHWPAELPWLRFGRRLAATVQASRVEEPSGVQALSRGGAGARHPYRRRPRPR